MEISELSGILKQNGIAGAGGAGFPAYAKLDKNVEIILLNCAECEPLLKLHKQMLSLFCKEIIKAFNVVSEALHVKEAVICLKREYKETTEAIKACIGSYSKIRIKELDDSYPMGDEVILIYEAAGRIIRPGGLPIEEGVIVYNVETMYNIYQALYEDKPVTEKYITIAGEVEKPITIKVPIGISYAKAVSYAGKITTDDPVYYIGGPMMGFISDKNGTVTKTTNGIIVLPSEHSLVLKKQRKASIDLKRAASACCQCQTCTDLCPRNGLGHPVEPHLFMRSAVNRDMKNIKAFTNTLFCSSCGLCEMYACPQGLSPRMLMSDYKNELRLNGIKPDKNADIIPINRMREYKKVPKERLKARLGIKKYDKEAPIESIYIQADRVKILLNQHIGRPSVPAVTEGERVIKGQLIGRADEGLSLPVHASMDGIVEEVTDTYIRINRL